MTLFVANPALTIPPRSLWDVTNILLPSKLSPPTSRDSITAGAHHALRVGAEHEDRAFLPHLEEECDWQHLFARFAAARRAIAAWIRWYNEARPHQTLG